MEKVMKVYETPAVEIVEMELQGIVCASANFDGTNDGEIDVEVPGTGGFN